MANFAERNDDQYKKHNMLSVTTEETNPHRRSWRRTVAALAAVVPLVLVTAGASVAQTDGNSGGLLTGEGLLVAMGFSAPLPQPGAPTTFVEIQADDTPLFGYVKNPYIGVVLGYAGTYTVNWGGNVTPSHRVPGRISFGNQIGSRIYSTDDKEALNGFPDDPSGLPQGYSVWPLASDHLTPYYNWCSYVRTQVDGGAATNMGFNTANTTVVPTFVNNVLFSEYDIGGGGTGQVNIRQEIRLFRSMAQIRWIIRNRDTVVHNVSLRFNVNVRSTFGGGGNNARSAFGRSGYYFQDPQRGVSDQTTLLQGNNVPAQLAIYGKRAEQDDLNDPPFAVRHIFSDYGATRPTSVYVCDPRELIPDNGGFLPQFTSQTLSQGLATGTYFGPYTVPAGGSTTIVTYYGNGVPTERLDEDFVTGTEAVESLNFDTNAVTRLDPANFPSTVVTPLDVAREFIQPNPITVIGGVYNRTQDNPLFSVNLNNVSAVLLLSDGFSLAPGETSSKLLGANGVISADRDAFTTWLIQPSGDKFGSIPYQMTVNTQEFGTRTVSRSITVPTSPVKAVTNEGFQMLGFPFQFDPILTNNGDPTTIINGSQVAQRIGYQRDEPVAFYRWVPDPLSITGQGGRYELATKLQPGISYMYRPNLSRSIILLGAQPVPGQAESGAINFTSGTFGSQQVQLLVERGWNMISNPYLYDIPFSNLRFVPTENNPTAASQSFQQAINSGLIKAGIFYFDPILKTYNLVESLNDTLLPWQGYWLFFEGRVSLIYSLPTQRNALITPVVPGPPAVEPPTRSQKTPPQKQKGNTNAFTSGKAFVTNPTTDEWRLHLVAKRQDGSGDRATIIGVSRSVQGDDNPGNLPKPPPPVSDYVYVGIVRKGANSRYAQEIQAAGAKSKTWEIEVVADKDGPVTLSWPNMSTMPRRLMLSLKDLTSGRSVGMRSASSLTFNMRKGQATRYQITATSAPTSRLAVTNLRMGGTRSIGGQEISFDVNQGVTVNGAIKTLGGKVVYTFARGRAVGAGKARFPWRGRAEDGSALPAGPYLVEITATPEGGDAVKVVQPFTSIR